MLGMTNNVYLPPVRVNLLKVRHKHGLLVFDAICDMPF